MARIELAPDVAEDFERILDHLERFEAVDLPGRVEEIVQAISVLAHNPQIGRPAKGENRELVIGRQSHGYVALYRYIEELDLVFVLAVKSQREAGYGRE